ncbi:T9SS type A sorting domain-containing protein [bacterium]|nr:T9SS type A sorting domain-containing protein [bacterium]
MPARRFLLMIWMLCSLSVFAQDLDIPLFEVADRAALGIPVVPYDRWGCTVADIDRNGWPDVNNVKWRGAAGSQVYLNFNGVFTDISTHSPQLIAIESAGNANRTPVYVDFDNDGDRDLFLGTDKTHHLFRNDNNVFIDITAAMGLTSSVPGFFSVYGYEMSSWIDFDRDGDNDVVVNQTNNTSLIFYRNDLTKFVNIADQVGLKNVLPTGADGDRGYYTGRMQWVDFDNDGDPDLNCGYLLFRNDNGHFTEVSQSVGFTPGPTMWFHEWLDYDNDGDMDFVKFLGGSQLFKNEGGTFVDASQEVSLDLFTRPHQASCNPADFDNDGDVDIFVQINGGGDPDPEALLLNDVDEYGNISFVDVGFYAGMITIGDRFGAAILDYDMDGLQDIFIPSQDYGYIMYHNLGPATTNNWIGFDLWGTKSARDPLGTLVTLYAGGKRQIRWTKAANTWKIQDSPYVHFGIGKTTRIDSVVIRWPLGNVEVLKDLAINQYHKITESSGTGVSAHPALVPQVFNLAQNYPNPFNPETRIDYTLPTAGTVLLEIYNVTGQRVAVLVDAVQTAGMHSVRWHGSDDRNQPLPSGLYTYRLSAGSMTSTRKMLYVR